MKFIGNDDIAIGVENLSKAVEFYERVLNLKLKKTRSNLRVYAAGGFTLYVEEGKPHPPTPSFTVESITEAKNLLTKNGCQILSEHETSLYFRDPTGIVWDIIEENK